MKNLVLKKPLACFDLEATGVQVATDRIVEVAAVKYLPNGTQEEFHKRVNPTIPIPHEATLVHGIDDAAVAAEPTFKQIAKSLSDFLLGCDLAGYNILQYDIPLLVEEFLRADVPFQVEQRKLVDAQRLFHLMEKRTLKAAYKFYCDKELVNAHRAMDDTLATAAVLDAQVARYAGQEVRDNHDKLLGKVAADVTALHALGGQQGYDWARRMVYNDEGVVVFNFGKHKGAPVHEVLKRDPSYYDWIMRGAFPRDTKRKLTQLKLGK